MRKQLLRMCGYTIYLYLIFIIGCYLNEQDKKSKVAEPNAVSAAPAETAPQMTRLAMH